MRLGENSPKMGLRQGQVFMQGAEQGPWGGCCLAGRRAELCTCRQHGGFAPSFGPNPSFSSPAKVAGASISWQARGGKQPAHPRAQLRCFAKERDGGGGSISIFWARLGKDGEEDADAT